MFEQIKKHQRALLVALIAVCMGAALVGGVQYFKKLQNNLLNNAIQDVMNVTLQQKQSFDNFISMERERLHDCAEYFSKKGHDSSDDMQELLVVFAGTDANFAVTCLEDSWTTSSKYGKVMHMEPEELAEYHSLTGSGIRDNYIGLVSGVPKFSFYESFTFQNGHSGLVQKTYNRSKVLETFSLSLYNGQGYGYILDQNGDILMRSVQDNSGDTYDNVFTALTDTHSSQEEINIFMEALRSNQTDVIRGMHILVVDDLKVNRILLTKILTTLGAVSDTASNGQEAVEKFEASQPGEYDLIMMDVQMPLLNGYEATRAIRSGEHPSAQSVPIIAMTANAFVDDVRDAIESGMDAHIAKPVQIDNLKATIQQVLDSRNERSKE